ncbi:subclass B3 metallo-beta-lactamase [Solimonas marina]|uniref:Subclass B3 metallo-beta-lactamase n=1 Tax=Solimonas marina TaxID=2714601 RepID=A0A970B5W7_9GAMM|nr:subclass B3 metallo-beta-lactamase [Solimonas marina]NKF22025.1 subclass B3 metallo-beta-lactamase [Solimonas marina]
MKISDVYAALSRVAGPRIALLMALAVSGTGPVWAQQASSSADVATGDDTSSCQMCVLWNTPVDPFRIYGNTYYVGSRGLSSILVVTSQGLVLIDGGLPDTASMIATNIIALGYPLSAVKYILNSHAHYDHAGGIAELARESGARVVMSPWSADVLRHGHSGPADPQYGALPSFPSLSVVQTIEDDHAIQLGDVRFTVHYTAGHTPGGTSWTWRSCENDRCADMVYADSLTAVSAPGFRFSAATSYPQVLKDFERSFATISKLDCDILLTPHPEASAFWQRREAQLDGSIANPYVEPGACKLYVDIARKKLQERLASEQAPPPVAAPGPVQH